MSYIAASENGKIKNGRFLNLPLNFYKQNSVFFGDSNTPMVSTSTPI